MPSLKAAITAIDKACRIWSVGYDQSNRQDIRDGGETDCSALVIWALKQGGFDTGNASYTGNLSSNLTKRGWVRLTPDISSAQPGDLLLHDGRHVAMVISGKGWASRIAQASIDERGRITGGKTGDQTGQETNERPIYVYRGGWNCILRYTGGTTEETPKVTGTGSLAIDGFIGPQTIAKWQKQLGTIVDGFISGQSAFNKKFYKNICSIGYDNSGASRLIKAIQKKLGIAVDGFLGPDTIKAIQRFVGANPDGYLGHETATKIQQSIEKGSWGSSTVAPSTIPNTKITVDGWLGKESIRAWQKLLGTPIDGVVSGQNGENKPYLQNLVSVNWSREGSLMVQALQRMVGTTADGYLGPETVKHIQSYVGVSVDGYLGSNTAAAIQKRINTGKF